MDIAKPPGEQHKLFSFSFGAGSIPKQPMTFSQGGAADAGGGFLKFGNAAPLAP